MAEEAVARVVEVPPKAKAEVQLDMQFTCRANPKQKHAKAT